MLPTFDFAPRSLPSLSPVHLNPVPKPVWLTSLRRAAATLFAAAVLAITSAFVGLSLAPRLGLYATYSVMSASMEPAIPVGSIVVVVPELPERLRPGDVIAVTSAAPPYTTVTHRIARVIPTAHGPEFKTKGDNNLLEDPWQFAFNGRAGKVILTLPLLGYLLVWSGSMWARLALAGCIAFVLTGFLLTRIWRPRPDPPSGALTP